VKKSENLFPVSRIVISESKMLHKRAFDRRIKDVLGYAGRILLRILGGSKDLLKCETGTRTRVRPVGF